MKKKYLQKRWAHFKLKHSGKSTITGPTSALKQSRIVYSKYTLYFTCKRLVIVLFSFAFTIYLTRVPVKVSSFVIEKSFSSFDESSFLTSKQK